MQGLPPEVAVICSLAVGKVVNAYHANLCAGDTGFLHRLKVFYHTLGRKIIIKPIPVDGDTYTVGRRHEILLDRRY